MPSVISGDANVSATEFGYLDGVTSALQTQMDAKLPIAGGKILQIVRATDTTLRSTTSTSFTDVTGMSVTITPQKNDSALIIIGSGRGDTGGGATQVGYYQLTDSSNNGLSGAQQILYGQGTSNGERYGVFLLGYVTPATTSAVTYKMRFKSQAATTTVYLENDDCTGQMYAIEVSA